MFDAGGRISAARFFLLFSGYLQNETMRERILNFIKIIDLGIQDIAVEENFIDNLSDSTTIPNDPLLKKIVGGISEAMSLALGSFMQGSDMVCGERRARYF